MMRRWTIAGASGAIALLALGMAAFRESSGAWAEAAPLIAGAILLIAGVIAAIRRGRDRGLAAFAFFGGAYFLWASPVAVVPRDVPLATPLIEWAAVSVDRVANPEPPIRYPPGRMTRKEFLKRPLQEREAIVIAMNLESERDRQYRQHRPMRLGFSMKIGHAWLALLLGAFGAILVRTFPARRGTDLRPARRSPHPPTSGVHHANRVDRHARPDPRDDEDPLAGGQASAD